MSEAKLSDIQITMIHMTSKSEGVAKALYDKHSGFFYQTDLKGYLHDSGVHDYVKEDALGTWLGNLGMDKKEAVFEIKDKDGKVVETHKGEDEIAQAFAKTFDRLQEALDQEAKEGKATKINEDLAERLEAMAEFFGQFEGKSKEDIAFIRDVWGTGATHSERMKQNEAAPPHAFHVIRSGELNAENKAAGIAVLDHVSEILHADASKVDLEAANTKLLELITAHNVETDYGQFTLDGVHDHHINNKVACKAAAECIREVLKSRETGVGADTVAKASDEPQAKGAAQPEKTQGLLVS